MSCGKCETCSRAPKNPVIAEYEQEMIELQKAMEIRIHGELTPEQKAVRQFLSKPAPIPTMCGCMGPRPLPGQDPNLDYHSVKRTPVCGCAMKWVEEVDGRFYKISENRSPDGITHTAKDLGPVGGPYLVDSYGRSI